MKNYLLTGGFAAVLLLGACGSEETEQAEAETEEATEEETEESTEEEKTEESTEESTEEAISDKNSDEAEELKDGEYEINMAKVKITDTEILPPGEYSDTGKDRLLVHYEVTSKVTPEEAGETTVSPSMVWIATVESTQETPDTIKSLDVGMNPMGDEYKKYLDTQSSAIKKGKTVEGIIVYELENRDNPVTLKVTQGMGGQDLGEYEVDVAE